MGNLYSKRRPHKKRFLNLKDLEGDSVICELGRASIINMDSFLIEIDVRLMLSSHGKKIIVPHPSRIHYNLNFEEQKNWVMDVLRVLAYWSHFISEEKGFAGCLHRRYSNDYFIEKTEIGPIVPGTHGSLSIDNGDPRVHYTLSVFKCQMCRKIHFIF